jgi:adenylosuccinate synthase
LIAPGAIIDVDQLLKEISQHNLHARVGIDPNAVVLDARDREQETALQLRKRIASTLSGTGSATSRKVLRDETLRLAGSMDVLSRWIADVPSELNRTHDLGHLVIVEGTQGFGLSLHHGDTYPFRTSRDTTAAGFLSEVGLSPFTVTDIVLVVRTFPIRVGGHSGPLKNEISWEELQRISGYPSRVEEYTSVTRTVRRVAKFDKEILRRAVAINRPTHLAVHGLDYLDYGDYGKTDYRKLGSLSKAFVCHLEEELRVPTTFLFTGPPNECVIDMRRTHQSTIGVACENVGTRTRSN